MSRSVDLFIDADLPLERLAAELGQRLDAAVAEDPGSSRWRLQLGEVTAHLGPHPYVDDRDLLLSRYRYALSARVVGDEALPDAREATVLRRASQVLRRETPWRLLLVLDLHYRDPGPSSPANSSPPDPGSEGAGAARGVSSSGKGETAEAGA